MCFVSIQLYHRRITRRRALHEMREAATVAVLGDETLRAIAQQRDHRLGREGKRESKDACAREADSDEARLSAGQAGAGDADGAPAGGGAV